MSDRIEWHEQRTMRLMARDVHGGGVLRDATPLDLAAAGYLSCDEAKAIREADVAAVKRVNVPAPSAPRGKAQCRECLDDDGCGRCQLDAGHAGPHDADKQPCPHCVTSRERELLAQNERDAADEHARQQDDRVARLVESIAEERLKSKRLDDFCTERAMQHARDVTALESASARANHAETLVEIMRGERDAASRGHEQAEARLAAAERSLAEARKKIDSEVEARKREQRINRELCDDLAEARKRLEAHEAFVALVDLYNPSPYSYPGLKVAREKLRAALPPPAQGQGETCETCEHQSRSEGNRCLNEKSPRYNTTDFGACGCDRWEEIDGCVRKGHPDKPSPAAEPEHMADIPRRARLDKMTPAERAITDAMLAVERAGCDVRLTDAINALSKARDLVADVVDGIPIKPKPSTFVQTRRCGTLDSEGRRCIRLAGHDGPHDDCVGDPAPAHDPSADDWTDADRARAADAVRVATWEASVMSPDVARVVDLTRKVDAFHGLIPDPTNTDGEMAIVDDWYRAFRSLRTAPQRSVRGWMYAAEYGNALFDETHPDHETMIPVTVSWAGEGEGK